MKQSGGSRTIAATLMTFKNAADGVRVIANQLHTSRTDSKGTTGLSS